MDDKPLLHVDSLSKVGPGKFFFDYGADRIYVGDNPAGHKLEASVANAAFKDNSSIQNVTISGLTVEKFASEAQHAAIESYSSGWIVKDSTVTLNHAGGVTVHNGTVSNSKLNQNGEWGLHDAKLAENNEIAFNNYAGFDYNWEAGGAKFAYADGVTVRGNNVHDNFGNGLWDDIDSHNMVYENNTVTNNKLNGIFHEIGENAIIRNNTLSGNGATITGNGVTAQITVYSSSNTEVYGNQVTGNPNGDAIEIIQDLRDGHWYAHDDSVHDNTIYAGVTGQSNYWGYWPANANIKFDNNTYVGYNANSNNWVWQDLENWAGFQQDGQELHGILSGAALNAVASSGFLTGASYGQLFIGSTIPEPRPLIYVALGVAYVFLTRQKRWRYRWVA